MEYDRRTVTVQSRRKARVQPRSQIRDMQQPTEETRPKGHSMTQMKKTSRHKADLQVTLPKWVEDGLLN